jgi:pheromone shutdown-related protein TraB
MGNTPFIRESRKRPSNTANVYLKVFGVVNKSADKRVLLRCGGREFLLVGTGHVMRASVKLVRESFREFHPDAVAVELDAQRFMALRKRERPSLGKLLAAKDKRNAIVYLVLHSFQARAGKEMGMRPGRDMLSAVEEAQKHRVPLLLIDRDVRETMRRATRRLTLKEKLNIVQSLIQSMFGLTKTDINSVFEHQDELMLEFRKQLPSAYRALVTERDEFMARALASSAAFNRVLVVVGAGHVPGLTRRLTRQLNCVPEATRRIT